PRAASPQRRLDVLRNLSRTKVPCGVMVAALIPALNDKTLEEVLEAAAAAGAKQAAYVIMRLPHELKTLFKEWLAEHYPQRAEHVMSIVRQMRGGRENDPNFGSRMSGTGNYAELMEKRFEIACRRFGFNLHETDLDCGRFRPPSPEGQLKLF
ncbi:MAG: radical protein, partial [Burkholderiales bacterium]|nr:radical protein [Burkholderiales bacterium]